jgi:hypothetical protein
MYEHSTAETPECGSVFDGDIDESRELQRGAGAARPMGCAGAEEGVE